MFRYKPFSGAYKNLKKVLYQNVMLLINNKICCCQNNNVIQLFISPTETDIQTNGQIARQTDRDRETNRQTDRQTDKQTDRQITLFYIIQQKELFTLFLHTEKRNVQLLLKYLMAGGMLVNNYHVNFVLCNDGEQPFVVSELGLDSQNIKLCIYILIHLSIYLSFPPPILPSILPLIHPSIHPSIH